jgi:predicted MFS family arabinose efflux permease
MLRQIFPESIIAALQAYGELFRLPYVRELFLVACLSRLAARMFSVAIVLYVLNRFQSPLLAGWASFASLAPGLAVSPLAGVLLDRLGAARAMAVDMAASALLLLLLAFAGYGGLVDATILFVLVSLLSLTAPLGAAGIRVLIPEIVPPEARDRANALDTSSFAMIDVLGAALGGVFMGFAGPDVTMLIIALMPLAASFGLVGLSRSCRPAPSEHRGRLLGEVVAAVGYVLQSRSLRTLSLSYALYQGAWGILAVAVPVSVASVVGQGPAGDTLVGLLWAVAGLAGGLGALAAGQWRTQGRERVSMTIGILGSALAIGFLAILPSLPALAATLALVGLFSGPIDVAVLTLRQRRAAPHWLGRIMAVSMSLNMCGAPLGAALGGVLVKSSAPLAFAVAAVVAVAGALSAQTLIPDEQESTTI